MPAAPAPFVSFNDYLDANSGSLQQERGGLTTEASGAVDKANTDASALYGDAAYKQGAEAAQGAWSSQRMAGNQPGAQKVTSSEQYQAPTGGTFDAKAVKLTPELAKEQEDARQKVTALQAGGLGGGKGAFEAGLIGADQSFSQGAKQLQGKLDANSYLDDAAKQYQAGVSSFHPNPITTYQIGGDPRTAPTTDSYGQPVGNEGPVQKPHTVRRKYVNGKPVDGEEMP